MGGIVWRILLAHADSLLSVTTIRHWPTKAKHSGTRQEFAKMAQAKFQSLSPNTNSLPMLISFIEDNYNIKVDKLYQTNILIDPIKRKMNTSFEMILFSTVYLFVCIFHVWKFLGDKFFFFCAVNNEELKLVQFLR